MKENKPRALISDLLALNHNKPLPLVEADVKIEDLIEFMGQHPNYRLYYIVDAEGHLLGSLSLGRLMRHLHAPQRESGVLGHGIMDLCVAEEVKDLMEKDTMTTTPEEEVGQVLKQMTNHNVKEIPVIDEENRVIGALTILELWIKSSIFRAGGAESSVKL